MDYTQFESTPLGGINLEGFVKADDIVNIAVNYANNRTEEYFDIQIRLLSDETTRINVCARKEGESVFPYMYINAYRAHFSPQYLLNELKNDCPIRNGDIPLCLAQR